MSADAVYKNGHTEKKSFEVSNKIRALMLYGFVGCFY